MRLRDFCYSVNSARNRGDALRIKNEMLESQFAAESQALRVELAALEEKYGDKETVHP